MSEETIRVTRDEDVAWVRLSRPDVRNAFNAHVIAELRAAFESLATEPPDALRGVVLAGEGQAFCAGADVEWMRAAVGLSVDDNERDAAAMQAMFTAIDACPVPVIACRERRSVAAWACAPSATSWSPPPTPRSGSPRPGSGSSPL